MPLKHTRSFRVRYYECDANGHLNSANYLRYMQETAFDASAAAGYDLNRYAEMRRLWLIRESCIEFLQPLVYDDRVNVTTWIEDFRRVSSRRAYRFHKAGSGELVACAYTDWVFLDIEHNRPAAIPDILVQDFYPEGVPHTFPPRLPFPTPPPAPAGAYTMRRRVAWYDIDSMLHVNNAVYMVYANECGFQATAACGWPWKRLMDADCGIFIRRAQIQYLLPALQDDEVEIATWVYNVRRASAMRHYTIRRVSDGALLAQISNLSAWVSPSSGKPVRIPREMLAELAAQIAE
jgi:acyl-CoA thioester hydrolase